jgi:sugar phosphate isomerase/epimerase
MFGVSPAYFLSRFTDRFTSRDIARSLPDLRRSGFRAFQPEVFHPANLEEWRKEGAVLIKEAADASGLVASQFVGHFLLHAFTTPEALASDFGIDETKKALEGVQQFPECGVLTVVIPAFTPSAPASLTPQAYAGFRSRLVEKLGRMLEITADAGRRLALEVLPGSLLGGTQGLLRLGDELGSSAFGYNFDTGHAWSCKEWVPLIPAAMGTRIFGTHLKDNLQHENLALAPGQGSIPWRETLGALKASGYAGSMDIEFLCEPDRAIQEYEQALGYLTSVMEEPAPGAP